MAAGLLAALGHGAPPLLLPLLKPLPRLSQRVLPIPPASALLFLLMPLPYSLCAICSQNSRAIILPHAYHARHLPCHHYFYFRTPTSPPSNSRTRASPSGDTRAARRPSSATSRAPTSLPSTATAPPPRGDRARLPPARRPHLRPPLLPRRRGAIQQREKSYQFQLPNITLILA